MVGKARSTASRASVPATRSSLTSCMATRAFSEMTVVVSLPFEKDPMHEFDRAGGKATYAVVLFWRQLSELRTRTAQGARRRSDMGSVGRGCRAGRRPAHEARIPERGVCVSTARLVVAWCTIE